MIDVSYVNNSSKGYVYRSANWMMDDIIPYIEAVLDDMDAYMICCEKEDLNKRIMTPYYESKHTVYNEAKAVQKEKKNIFARIGEGIVKVIDTIIKKLGEIIEGIKNFSFRFKTDNGKMKAILKAHPEASKEDINLAISKGYLDFNAMKYFKDVDSLYKEAMRKIGKGEGGVQEFFKNGLEKLKGPYGLVAGAVGGSMTFIKAVDYLNKRPAELERAMSEEIKAYNEIKAQLESEYKKANANASADDVKAAGERVNFIKNWQLKQAITAMRANDAYKAMNIVKKSLDKIKDATNAKVSKYGEKMSKNAQAVADREEREKAARLKEKEEEAVRVQTAKDKAKNQNNGNNP